jgi:hypothetical protein
MMLCQSTEEETSQPHYPKSNVHKDPLMESVQRNHLNRMETEEFHTLGRFVQQDWSQLAQGDEASEEKLHTLSLPALAVIGHLISGKSQTDRRDLSLPFERMLIYEKAGLKIECLELGAGGCIPAHDHPQTIGINQLIRGSVWVIQADRSRPEIASTQKLNTGATSFIFPERNNIHGFYTDTDPATLISLNITQNADHPLHRNWHLSTNLISEVHAELARPIGYALMWLVLSSYPAPSVASGCIMNQAQYELSRQNFIKAAALLEDCAEKGHEKAQRKLGDLYLAGLGVEKDAYTAAQWYQKAARQGDMEAQYRYGIMLLDGNGITEDNLEGFDWIFEAASAGHSRARQVYEYIQANPAPLEC